MRGKKNNLNNHRSANFSEARMRITSNQDQKLTSEQVVLVARKLAKEVADRPLAILLYLLNELDKPEPNYQDITNNLIALDKIGEHAPVFLFGYLGGALYENKIYAIVPHGTFETRRLDWREVETLEVLKRDLIPSKHQLLIQLKKNCQDQNQFDIDYWAHLNTLKDEIKLKMPN